MAQSIIQNGDAPSPSSPPPTNLYATAAPSPSIPASPTHTISNGTAPGPASDYGSFQSPPASPTSATASSTKVTVAIASVLAAVITAAMIVFFIFRLRRSKKRRVLAKSVPAIYPTWQAVSVFDPSPYAPMSYTYLQLSQATDDFNASLLLGKGGFGPVFKGCIDGTNVAVKCVDDDSRQGYKEFKAEVNIISNLRHRNLVKLRGWCYEDSKCFVVYDYVPNGSLDKMLFDDERCKTELSWERRFGIVLGLGSAVQYLHEECENVIIHRDIKSSNVLLDEKYAVKLGDFGLSRQMGDTQILTTVVAGTRGYIAPEVFITGKSNKESDVFSFGAVLAEIACGRRVIDGRGVTLVDWVWNHLSEGVLVKATDERLGGNFNKEEMERVLVVALSCSHPDPSARPSIRQAMDALRETSPLPYVPIFKPVPTYNNIHRFGEVDDATSSSYQATSPRTFASRSSVPHPDLSTSTGF